MEDLELSEQEILTLEILQQKKLNCLTLKLKQAEDKIQSLNVDLEKQSMITGQINQKVDKLAYDLSQQFEKISQQKEATFKTHVSLGALGAMHAPLIGAVFMGKLLRIVGICQKESNYTKPYSTYTEGEKPLVMNLIGERGYSSFYYHGERTWKLIRKHLSELDVLNDFDACQTKSAIHDFIEKLS